VGKLYGGHQATVISLAVADNWAVTGSKDRCLKVCTNTAATAAGARAKIILVMEFVN